MLYDEALSTVATNARRHGGKTAIICGSRSISYVELDDRVGRLATVLRDCHGLGPGRVASLYGPVCWEWVVAYHAILRTGATVNPINGLLTADEVHFILSDCSSCLIIADAGRLDTLRTANAMPAGVDGIAFESIDALSTAGAILPPPEARDPEALSTICYTSGTTGRPKGAMLSHRNVLMNAGLTNLMHGRSSDDVVVTALPLAHVYGNVVMNGSLIAGATLVLLPAFSPDLVFAAIADHRATRFEGVPTMYYRLLSAPTLAQADLSSLRLCTVGGQTMPAEKMADVEARFGCPLIELWGMSEIAGLGTTFPWTGPRALGAIGLPLPGLEVRTIDPTTGHRTDRGEPGELQIRGAVVMQGYWNQPDATRAVLDPDGWLATGDIARIDDVGHVYIVDRMKDVILTSGNNVYPAELERVIAAIPGVAMVGVGKDSHPEKGEVPHAYIVCNDGARLSAEAVIAHCREFLAPYKLPRGVTFVEDLPKTSSGKIMRRSLGSTAVPDVSASSHPSQDAPLSEASDKATSPPA